MHPVFNPVALYGYLRPTVYLFMADIANPDLVMCSCRTWICLDITRTLDNYIYIYLYVCVLCVVIMGKDYTSPCVKLYMVKYKEISDFNLTSCYQHYIYNE